MPPGGKIASNPGHVKENHDPKALCDCVHFLRGDGAVRARTTTTAPRRTTCPGAGGRCATGGHHAAFARPATLREGDHERCQIEEGHLYGSSDQGQVLL